MLEERREVDQETEEPRDDNNGGHAVHMYPLCGGTSESSAVLESTQ